jgi:hypothetical protein
MKRETEDGYKRTNRELSKEPRGSGMCYGCDRSWVPGGAKCKVCGSVMDKPRGKAGKLYVKD